MERRLRRRLRDDQGRQTAWEDRRQRLRGGEPRGRIGGGATDHEGGCGRIGNRRPACGVGWEEEEEGSGREGVPACGREVVHALLAVFCFFERLSGLAIDRFVAYTAWFAALNMEGLRAIGFC